MSLGSVDHFESLDGAGISPTSEHFFSGPPLDLLIPQLSLRPRSRRSSSTSSTRQSNLVAATLKSCIEEFSQEKNEDPFYVADLGEVYRLFWQWKRLLPRVEPFYAVKCNPDLQIVQLLANLGAGFDCASKTEIDLIMRFGIQEDQIIFANPCKQPSHVRYAAERGVKLMTFDNADELYKCKKLYPDAHLILRILADDANSLCRLGLKYGAPLNLTFDLLQLAKELGLNIVGVSFHVGSGNDNEPSVFVDACERARRVFDEAKELGFGDLRLLDVGGGFGHDNFEDISKFLGPAIDRLFPKHVQVIAEPGRYFVASAFTLVVNVIARRLNFSEDTDVDDEIEGVEKSVMYYVNDGIYGAFNCILFDHQQPMPQILTHKRRFYYSQPFPRHTQVGNQAYDALADAQGMVSCSIWGPTCDSLDCISREVSFPCVLDIGDWLYFNEMGAYTICASTEFNGFERTKIVYICSEPKAEEYL